jgi:hypothetical protein
MAHTQTVSHLSWCSDSMAGEGGGEGEVCMSYHPQDCGRRKYVLGILNRNLGSPVQHG